MNTNIEIKNKIAEHNYFIKETIECGIELRGNEVKSVRNGLINLKGSWVAIQDGELFLRGAHITKWETANMFDVDEKRDRKLLAHKKEIKHMTEAIKLKGITLIPLRIYRNKNKFKCEVGLCIGKHLYDKREENKKRDIQREISRNLNRLTNE